MCTRAPSDVGSYVYATDPWSRCSIRDPRWDFAVRRKRFLEHPASKFGRNLAQMFANRVSVRDIFGILHLDLDGAAISRKHKPMGGGVLIESHGGRAARFRLCLLMYERKMLSMGHPRRHLGVFLRDRRKGRPCGHDQNHCREVSSHVGSFCGAHAAI